MFTEKSDFQWESSQKTDIEKGIAQKGGFGDFANLRGGGGWDLTKRGGGAFEGRLMSQCTLRIKNNFIYNFSVNLIPHLVNI